MQYKNKTDLKFFLFLLVFTSFLFFNIAEAKPLYNNPYLPNTIREEIGDTTITNNYYNITNNYYNITNVSGSNNILDGKMLGEIYYTYQADDLFTYSPEVYGYINFSLEDYDNNYSLHIDEISKAIGDCEQDLNTYKISLCNVTDCYSLHEATPPLSNDTIYSSYTISKDNLNDVFSYVVCDIPDETDYLTCQSFSISSYPSITFQGWDIKDITAIKFEGTEHDCRSGSVDTDFNTIAYMEVGRWSA